jgi:hypothetical protein
VLGCATAARSVGWSPVALDEEGWTGMASGGKQKTTFSKLAHESKRREHRLEKQAKKASRKRAAENQPPQLTDTPAAEQR